MQKVSNVMDNITKTTSFKLFLLTPIFVLLSHYLALFPHEYAHSFTAWLLGYKSNPFDLNYGGTSFLNLLLFFNIDQNVNNQMIYSLGHPGHVALIAFAGPGMNILLFILSFWLLKNEKVKLRPYLFYFLLFFNLMNLGNIYDYVPIRTFATQGNMVDILDIEQGLNISPWLVYIIVGYPLAFLIWQFFTKTLTSAYVNLRNTNTILRAGLMIICVCILFGYFGMPGFFSHGDIPYFISATSLLAIPGIIIALWSTRKWVKQQLQEYKETASDEPMQR
jgi:hypothetical protein